MSVAELKERHVAATETVNSLREQLRQRRLALLDTDGQPPFDSFVFFFLFLALFHFILFYFGF